MCISLTIRSTAYKNANFEQSQLKNGKLSISTNHHQQYKLSACSFTFFTHYNNKKYISNHTQQDDVMCTSVWPEKNVPPQNPPKSPANHLNKILSIASNYTIRTWSLYVCWTEAEGLAANLHSLGVRLKLKFHHLLVHPQRAANGHG